MYIKLIFRYAMLILILSTAYGNEKTEPKSLKKMATISYLSWFNPAYLGSGYLKDTDFPVIPLSYDDDHLAEELLLMKNYGWQSVGIDLLLFTDAHSERMKNLCEAFEKAIDSTPQLAGFKFFPWIESKDQDGLVKGMLHFNTYQAEFKHLLKIKGKPVVLMYSAQGKSFEYWTDFMNRMKQSDVKYFWIYECGGLQQALYGKCDLDKYRKSQRYFDSIFTFSASGLEACANMVQTFRSGFSDERTGQYIGGSVWPGYLSARETSKNFISPRGTEFFRNTWRTILKLAPDFIHGTTWNDFHEATTHSCSYSMLTSRLEIDRYFLSEYFTEKPYVADLDEPEIILSYRKELYAGEPFGFEILILPVKKKMKGKITVKYLNEKGEIILSETSDEYDFGEYNVWKFSSAETVKRSETKLLHVAAEIEYTDGSVKKYSNIPDVPIALPSSYADQLFYSVPLYKTASDDYSLSLCINGVDGNSNILHNGFINIDYICKNKAGKLGFDKTYLAGMRNGKPTRYLSPLSAYGAEFTPGKLNRKVVLQNNNGKSYWLDWRSSENSRKENYYAAVALLPNGKWAYSKTVWCRPVVPVENIIHQWIFAPSVTKADNDIIIDRYGNGNLNLIKGKVAYKPVSRFLSLFDFNGETSFSAPEISIGPSSMEVTFKVGNHTNGNSQVVLYQRGAALSLVLDEKGFLVAKRLPSKRVAGDKMFVTVTSRHDLLDGRFHQACVIYSGKKLILYIDGKKQGEEECFGTRSTECFFIGGPPPGNNEVLSNIDDLQPDAYFQGYIARVTAYNNPLSEKVVEKLYSLFKQQPAFQK